MEASTHLIDKIMPRNEVHLLGGTSDAGKTRFLFRFLLDWYGGSKTLGYDSTPCPWLYVCADRTTRSAIRTMEDMSIDPASIPMIGAFGAENKNMRQIVQEATKRKVELVVVEAFQRFVEGRQGPKDVESYLNHLSTYTDPCPERPNGLTFFGVCESPKLKPQERYQDARQRITGVSAWGYFSSTVFLIEREDPTDATNNNRRLFVCPKVGQRVDLPGRFDQNGHLTFGTPAPRKLTLISKPKVVPLAIES